MTKHTEIGQKIREAIGESEVFIAFQEKLSKAAKVDRPVLLVGERGTGKELAAARLHYLSNRWKEPLWALNCAALAPNLIESELFGYEAGAFTGAGKRRAGRFEAAHGGTLFLDEIGNIPLEVQAKILRVVEYQTFERVGSPEAVQVDVRIIGATNADLPLLADQGKFQKDLLDRLSFEVLEVPPLRERSGDIQLLAGYFASRMAHELGKKDVPVFSDETLGVLEEYRWPGNVRELKNVVERAVYKADNDLIEEIIFDPFPKRRLKDSKRSPKKEEKTVDTGSKEEEDLILDKTLSEQVRDLEIRLVRKAMAKAKYNQKEAAELLGLTYHQFRGLYRKYGNLDDDEQ